MEAIAIPKGFRVTPEQFEQLASAEQLARMELTKDGELIVMSPTGGTAGEKNFNLCIDLGIWNRQTKLGKAFDSSTIFGQTEMVQERLLILLQCLFCLMVPEEVLTLAGLD